MGNGLDIEKVENSGITPRFLHEWLTTLEHCCDLDLKFLPPATYLQQTWFPACSIWDMVGSAGGEAWWEVSHRDQALEGDDPDPHTPSCLCCCFGFLVSMRWAPFLHQSSLARCPDLPHRPRSNRANQPQTKTLKLSAKINFAFF